MANLTPFVRDIRGVYSDRARDRLPDGSLWQLRDWVPLILQAGARIRGAWKYQSPALTNPPDGMLYAPFRAGSRLLVANGTAIHSVPVDSVGATSIGTIPAAMQNPVFWRNRAIVPAADGTSPARFIVFDGTTFTLTDAPGTALTGRFACIFKDRLVLGNSVGEPTQVAFCKPGDPTIPWDSISKISTSYMLTGIAAQRTQVLCFHQSSVERLRGTTPPDSTLTDQTGDMILDVLFDRAGCYDARSIAYQNDNVLFADARGIFLTDGAIVRNVTQQGGASNLWRETFELGGTSPLSIAGVVHQDYYICVVRHSGQPPISLVLDIDARRLFTLSNIDAACLAYSVGAAEKLFGVQTAEKRVTDLTPVFEPDSTVMQIDGNGTPVLPRLSSGWEQLNKKPGYKRVLDLHFSYLADRDDDVEVLRASYGNTPTGTDRVLGELHTQPKFHRRKMAVRRRLEGLSVTLEQLVPTRDTRLFDISVRQTPEESSRT
jgi:hypothetical protein